MVDLGSKDFSQDPWASYANWLSHSPRVWSANHNCYFIFDYLSVKELLKDQRLKAYHPFRASRVALGTTLLDMDGDDHLKLRSSLANLFSENILSKIRSDYVDSVVNDLFRHLNNKIEIDGFKEIACKIPIRVIARMMGIQDSTADHIYSLLTPLINFIDQPSHLMDGLLDSRKFLTLLACDTLKSQTFQNSIFYSTLKSGLQDMNEKQKSSVLILMWVAGSATTTASIANLLNFFVNSPHEYENLLSGKYQVTPFISEFLRMEPPLHFTARFPDQTFKFKNLEIQKGSAVQLCLASANRDPTEFKDPDKFLVNRKQGTGISFGWGAHRCMGFGLAQYELKCFVEFLLKNQILDLSKSKAGIQKGRGIRYPQDLSLTFKKVA